MKLGLREANQQFSKAIKAVRAGKEVVLTDRGRAFAVIKPLTARTAEAGALQAMVDEGFVVPAARKGPLPAPSRCPVRVKRGTMSQTIIEGREERG